jgi:hypothetical protein
VIAYRLLLSPVSSTNKSDRHDITEKLLKAALNSIKDITSSTVILQA